MLLRLLPVVGFFGVLIPLVGLGVLRPVIGNRVDAAQWEVVEFWLMGATVVYWSIFMTVLVACTIAWAFRRGKTMLFSSAPSDRT